MREETNDEPCDPPSLSLVVDTETPTFSKDRALPHYVATALYPKALHAPIKSNKETTTESIMDTFRQVKANIPLLDVIKQVPAYVKFLKNLCIQNRKLRVHMNKQVKLVEHMSSILLGHFPPKLKDPEAPTISCVIGDYMIDRALLDLGASLNLLLYLVFKKVNLGGLKPTPVTLNFSNQSVKRPWIVKEDALVKVNEFYYPIDFIVLDMKPSDPTKDPIPILLEQPFLVMANACIQCKTGIMNFSLGNMQLWLNVFYAFQHPPDHIQVMDIDMIEECVEEVAPQLCGGTL
ncbi:uncharacterized protein LOC131143644 [Malania oleifera]|uniref:uncharacterized protein LOC131143644 n=1 Tax=Malania oleifera TaxID=397392 RepID=UPI0025AECC58|nr:uncharacterized protein LOC131143644 [Malania oleifera]